MMVILVTVPMGQGETIAEKILKKRLAACINIKNVRSIYWDNGNIVKEEEELLIIKTREELFDIVEKEIKSIHPYKIPEIVGVKVGDVNIEYLNWVESETSLKKIRESQKQ